MAARRRRKDQFKAPRFAWCNTDRVRGRELELAHFLSQQWVDICLLSQTFLNPGHAFRLANYVFHHTDRHITRWYSQPGAPWYSSPLSAIPGPDPLVGYGHPSHIGRQTGENPCGLSFAFPLTDPSGRDCLFRRGTAGPDGRRPQRHTRGLELAVDHETGVTPTCICRRTLLSDLWPGHTYYQPLQPIRCSARLGHRDNREPNVPGLSDFLLGTKLGPPSSTHWQYVSLILSTPTG
jgi:hypothetical protein